MELLNYNGFHGFPSQCGYGSNVIDGTPVMVFEHKMVGTSPQNMIEELTAALFNRDFPGLEPNGLRVFEVDFSGQGLFTYQEVIFDEVCQPDSGVFSRPLVALGFRDPPAWHFNKPRWNPLTPADQAWLKGLIDTGQL